MDLDGFNSEGVKGYVFLPNRNLDKTNHYSYMSYSTFDITSNQVEPIVSEGAVSATVDCQTSVVIDNFALVFCINVALFKQESGEPEEKIYLQVDILEETNSARKRSSRLFEAGQSDKWILRKDLLKAFHTSSKDRSGIALFKRDLEDVSLLTVDPFFYFEYTAQDYSNMKLVTISLPGLTNVKTVSP
jgi:hypothetical protein